MRRAAPSTEPDGMHGITPPSRRAGGYWMIASDDHFLAPFFKHQPRVCPERPDRGGCRAIQEEAAFARHGTRRVFPGAIPWTNPSNIQVLRRRSMIRPPRAEHSNAREAGSGTWMSISAVPPFTI